MGNETNAMLAYSLDDGEISNSRSMYCSMTVNSPEDKARLYNISNSPDYRITDFIGKQISIKDVYFETVDLTNSETGEIITAPRIVLIDDHGKGYQCVSMGIYSALRKLMLIYGRPTWETPIKVEVIQVKTGSVNKVLSLKVVV